MVILEVLIKIKTSNISNIFTSIILKLLRKTTADFVIDNLDSDLQGEFKTIFKNVSIQVYQTKHVPGLLRASVTYSDSIKLRLDKNFAGKFRSENINNIHELRLELLTQIEHEITHIIQHYKFPESKWYMKSYDNLNNPSDKYFNKYKTDYTEIEAHARQIIKLAKDYKLPIYTAIDYYNGVFIIDWKLLYKKLYRLDAFDTQYWKEFPGEIIFENN